MAAVRDNTLAILDHQTVADLSAIK